MINKKQENTEVVNLECDNLNLPKESKRFSIKSNGTLFVIIFLLLAMSPITTSFDSRWSIFVAKSIYTEANIDLDEYINALESNSFYAIKKHNSHYYNRFPLGTPLLSMPLVFTFDICGYPILEKHRTLEKTIASFFVALSAVFVFLLSSRKLSRKKSILLTIAYTFGTSMWSTASRALWQHGPSALMLVIALFILIKSEEKEKLVQYVSLPLAYSFFVRPTNAVPILLLTIFVFLKYRKYFVRYILWALLVTLPFLIHNLLVYNNVLSPYYFPNRLSGDVTATFIEAMLGNLVSPSRGLLMFSPFIIFSYFAVIEAIRDPRKNLLNGFLFLSILLHWIVISKFPHWWGGHSYGPRFFADMMPFFAFLLIPFLEKHFGWDNVKKSLLSSLFWVLLLWSIFVNFKGATIWKVYLWNSHPTNVDETPYRLWDFSDPQFLR